MPNIEGGMRTRIAEFLPQAFAKALVSYQLFLDEGAHEDAKDFKAHHDACKVAVAHIELLIKLAQWADLPDETEADEAQQKALAALIKNAKTELGKHKGESDE